MCLYLIHNKETKNMEITQTRFCYSTDKKVMALQEMEIKSKGLKVTRAVDELRMSYKHLISNNSDIRKNF